MDAMHAGTDYVVQVRPSMVLAARMLGQTAIN
jgi:hypothetical protein